MSTRWIPLRRTAERWQQEANLWTLQALLFAAVTTVLATHGYRALAILPGVMTGYALGMLTMWFIFGAVIPKPRSEP